MGTATWVKQTVQRMERDHEIFLRVENAIRQHIKSELQISPYVLNIWETHMKISETGVAIPFKIWDMERAQDVECLAQCSTDGSRIMAFFFEYV